VGKEASIYPSTPVYNDHQGISLTSYNEMMNMVIEEMKSLKNFSEPLKDAYKF